MEGLELGMDDDFFEESAQAIKLRKAKSRTGADIGYVAKVCDAEVGPCTICSGQTYRSSLILSVGIM